MAAHLAILHTSFLTLTHCFCRLPATSATRQARRRTPWWAPARTPSRCILICFTALDYAAHALKSDLTDFHPTQLCDHLSSHPSVRSTDFHPITNRAISLPSNTFLTSLPNVLQETKKQTDNQSAGDKVKDAGAHRDISTKQKATLSPEIHSRTPHGSLCACSCNRCLPALDDTYMWHECSAEPHH